MNSSDSPRRSRRIAGLAPDTTTSQIPPPTGEFMTPYYYPNRTPRNGVSCSYISAVAIGVLGVLALARVAAAAFSGSS